MRMQEILFSSSMELLELCAMQWHDDQIEIRIKWKMKAIKKRKERSKMK